MPQLNVHYLASLLIQRRMYWPIAAQLLTAGRLISPNTAATLSTAGILRVPAYTVLAMTAIVLAIELTAWNSAAYVKLMRRVAFLSVSDDGGGDVAVFNASQRRYTALTTLRIMNAGGHASNRPTSPTPTSATMTEKPAATPSMWGRVRRRPKFAPDAISIMLFGPDVIDETNAKPTSAASCWRYYQRTPIAFFR